MIPNRGTTYQAQAENSQSGVENGCSMASNQQNHRRSRWTLCRYRGRGTLFGSITVQDQFFHRSHRIARLGFGYVGFGLSFNPSSSLFFALLAVNSIGVGLFRHHDSRRRGIRYRQFRLVDRIGPRRALISSISLAACGKSGVSRSSLRRSH